MINPETIGPNARPTPIEVPNQPNARMRRSPSNAWASRALPPVVVAAAPAPASARPATSTAKPGASAASSIPPQKTATPAANIRRRPIRSASEPVTAMRLAKVKKNASTTHCAALSPVCRLASMPGSASDAPVAEIGTSTIAAHTIARVVPGRRLGGVGSELREAIIQTTIRALIYVKSRLHIRSAYHVPMAVEDRISELLDRRLGTWLRAGDQALMAAKTRALRPHGLSVPQYAALHALSVAPLSGAQMARACCVTPQSTATMLATLERRGLIERTRSEVHGMVLIASLTLTGRATFEQADAAALAVEAEVSAAFSAEEEAALREMLARAARVLDAVATDRQTAG
jgi:DNA-binding MarR family transcriptional regulator